MTARDKAERLAKLLFPDDYHNGQDCRAEIGREGQPCRACADQASAWQAKIDAVATALAAEPDQAPTPRLFSWWSVCLKQYGQGRVAAVAGNEDEARDLIRAGLLAWLCEQRPYEFADDGEPTDEDAAEWVAESKALLEKDLEAAPEIGATLFIAGSE